MDGADPDRLAAERFVPVRNAGWVEVTIESLELPELDAVTWGDVDGLPVTLGPGEVHEVAIPFTVEGCDIDARGVDDFRFRASAPFGPSTIVTVPALGSIDPGDRVTHRGEDGGSMTLPIWQDQPQSWILDAIHPHCSQPPGTG